jgi:hypothetical protein
MSEGKDDDVEQDMLALHGNCNGAELLQCIAGMLLRPEHPISQSLCEPCNLKSV